MTINSAVLLASKQTKCATAVYETLQEISGECALAGTLTLRGICKKCKELQDE